MSLTKGDTATMRFDVTNTVPATGITDFDGYVFIPIPQSGDTNCAFDLTLNNSVTVSSSDLEKYEVRYLSDSLPTITNSNAATTFNSGSTEYSSSAKAIAVKLTNLTSGKQAEISVPVSAPQTASSTVIYDRWEAQASYVYQASDRASYSVGSTLGYLRASYQTYDVSFDTNGGSTAPETQTVGHTAIKPDNPTKAGYTFGGWYTDADCTDGNKWDFSTEVTYDMTLYAKWTANAYDVTYTAGTNGSITPATAGESVEYDATPTMKDATTSTTVTATANTDYYLTGWDYSMVKADGSGTVTSHVQDPGTVKILGKTTFTATFAHVLAIAYTKGAHGAFTEGDEGTTLFSNRTSGANMPSYSGATEDDIASRNLGKVKGEPGWTFAGWSTDGKTAITVPSTVTGNATYIALWTEDTGYTVKYDVNNGAGTLTDLTGVSWTQTDLLSATNPTRGGYTFDGWSTTKDDSTTKVTATTPYSTLANNIDSTANATLYALWTETTATASDITLKSSEVTDKLVSGALPDSQLISWNSASGTVDGKTATPTVKSVSGRTSLTAGTVGVYTVTYTVGTGTAAKTVSAIITVVSDDTAVSTDQLYDVTAKSVTLTSSAAKTAFADAGNATVLEGTAYNDVSTAKRATTADDWTTTTGEPGQDCTGWSNIKAGTVGVYPVTYSNTDDPANPQVSKTVTVTIVDDDTAVSADQLFDVSAKSVTLTSSAAKTAFENATDSTALEASAYNNASAKHRTTTADNWTGSALGQAFDNGDTDWQAIKNGTKGSYNVTYTNTDDTATPQVSKDVQVIITSDTAVIEPTTNCSVDAHTVSITPDAAKDLAAASDLYGSTLNDVSGYLDGTAITADGLTTDVTQTFADPTNDWADINAGKKGTYEVTYKVTSKADDTKSASKTVKVIIADKQVAKDGIVATGNDFVIAKSDVAAATDDAIIKLAGAAGVDTNGSVETAATMTVKDRTELVAAVGQYPVTFTATGTDGKTATVTVTATVKDNVITENGITIGANDFLVKQADAKTATDTQVIGWSAA